METGACIMLLLIGFLGGILAASACQYLYQRYENNTLYKPGTGKIYTYEIDYEFTSFINNIFPGLKIPYKFCRDLGHQKIEVTGKKPNVMLRGFFLARKISY
jgi:hypothetical protein